jgi:hypothetical protein
LIQSTVFVELRFWLLVVCSIVAPGVIYAALLAKRTISRKSVLVFGIVLVVLAGLDVYLLQGLARLARLSVSAADDAVFASEVSVALYLLPILFGGVGVNLVSHVLISHLMRAENQFDREHPHP